MKGNKEFTEDFFNSFGAVFVVGAYLKRLGFNVTVPVPEIRPDVSERMKYMDEGDLLVSMPVQIKERSISFTCQDDYPYDTIFIDEQYKVKKDTFMYVIVSSDNAHAAIIKRGTRAKWVTQTIYDQKQGRECTNRCCPKELAVFVKLRPDAKLKAGVKADERGPH